MIKGALIFTAGLAVGTAYGFGYGLRFSKAMVAIAETTKKQPPTSTKTVPNNVISSAEKKVST